MKYLNMFAFIFLTIAIFIDYSKEDTNKMIFHSFLAIINLIMISV